MDDVVGGLGASQMLGAGGLFRWRDQSTHTITLHLLLLGNANQFDRM